MVGWIVLLGFWASGRSSAQQAPSVLPQPRDAVVVFRKGTSEADRAVVRDAVRRLLRAVPRGSRLQVARTGVERIASPTVSEVVLGAAGSVLLNPGAETQSFNAGFVYLPSCGGHDDQSLSLKLMTLLRAQGQGKEQDTLQQARANADRAGLPAALGVGAWAAMEHGLGKKRLADLLAGDRESDDAEAEAVTISDPVEVSRLGLYGRLGFATSNDFAGANGATASGALVSPALGAQYILRSGKYTIGAEAGWTGRLLTGDIALSSNEGIRSYVLGTSRTSFSGFEVTLFASIDGKARPYVRCTNMPGSGSISGFSGGQVVIGTDIFVAF